MYAVKFSSIKIFRILTEVLANTGCKIVVCVCTTSVFILRTISSVID